MKLTLKYKIIGLVLIAAFLPVLVGLLVTGIQNWRISKIITGDINMLTREYVAQIAEDVHGLCKTADELVQTRVDNSLNVAHKILKEKGGVSVSSSQEVTWSAVNQYTKIAQTITVPKMYVGKEWCGHNRNFATRTPVVDDVKDLVGGTCTIFQRINEQGDMLRIATNVETLSKERAIGTFIPAVNPDGEVNPVVSSVLRGETYRGRAYVVNAWYITAYEPIKDRDGEVIGILYVGIKQEAVESLRNTIYGIKVGETGYVYVLGGTGAHRGHYIISKNGERDGEDISNIVDSEGTPFIQNIVNTALALTGGDVGFETYAWKNPGERKPRNKIVAIRYFEPWDWVIGAGIYEDDYYEIINKTLAELNRLFIWAMAGGGIILMIAVVIAMILGDKIVRPIENIISVSKKIARGDLFSAKQAVDVLHDSDTASDHGGLKTRIFSEDETQDLLTAIMGMTQNLHSLVGQVQHSGIQVTASTTQIAASARELETTVSQQAASTHEVVTTSKEISLTSRELANTMNEVGGVAVDTASLADSGRSDLEGMEGNIRQLMDATGSISSKLSMIREKANNIDTVITTINKVADQTNLLSLNASVEAEKAGEYGVGFSVVAREIRRLADQTAVATLDIEHMVKEMQSAVSSGVMEMDKFTEEVRVAVDNIGKISRQLELIIQRVQALPPRFEQVSEGMQSQSDSAQQISETMVQLNEAIQQTTLSLREFNSATEQLNEAARGLQNEVSRFKVSE